MNNLINLIRCDLRDYVPYSSARDEAKSGKIWLNANESPFAYDVDCELKLNRYPEKQPLVLRQQFAAIYGVNTDQIVLSRGSDEVIDLLIRLFCEAGVDAIMTCPPTYGMYAVSARLQGARIIEVPLIKSAGYQMDLCAMIDKWEPSIKLVFLCSPNNPTGNLLKKDDILFLCEKWMGKSMVVVDEAYLDYADTDSLSAHIDQYPNLIILRTLSKAYGLAGARFGGLIGQSALVEWIIKIIAPYPLASPIVRVVSEALQPARYSQIQNQIRQTNAEKKRLYRLLQALPYVKNIVPSDANFLLVEMSNADKIMNACTQDGIVIRSLFDKPGLADCLRISIGLPEENDQLISLLQRVGNV